MVLAIMTVIQRVVIRVESMDITLVILVIMRVLKTVTITTGTIVLVTIQSMVKECHKSSNWFDYLQFQTQP